MQISSHLVTTRDVLSDSLDMWIIRTYHDLLQDRAIQLNVKDLQSTTRPAES